jgi:hypothetical protein
MRPLAGHLGRETGGGIRGRTVGVGATCTGYLTATDLAKCASASAPVTMSLTPEPDRYSAPPVDTWMIPSLSASAKPRSAALSVWLEVTLIAG